MLSLAYPPPAPGLDPKTISSNNFHIVNLSHNLSPPPELHPLTLAANNENYSQSPIKSTGTDGCSHVENSDNTGSGDSSTFPDLRVPICTLCGKLCKDGSALTAHMNDQHSTGHSIFPSYTCEICEKMCPNYQLLIQHLQTDHRIPETADCSTCSQVFLNKEHLQHHIASTHTLDNPQYYGSCDSIFKTMHDLNLHMDHCSNVTQSTWNKGGLTCYKCDESFAFYDELAAHTRTYHTLELPLPPDLWSPLPPNLQSLPLTYVMSPHPVHQLNHTQASNTIHYGCEKCSQYFLTLEDLTIHQQLTHEGDPLVCVHCHFCEATFSSMRALNVHTSVHHERPGSSTPDTDSCTSETFIRSHAKVSTCCKCNASFQTHEHLKEHIRVKHDQPEPSPCNSCVQVSPSLNSIMGHPQIHQSHSNYTCTVGDSTVKSQTQSVDHSDAFHDKPLSPIHHGAYPN